jgi:hypothetical protein
MGNKKLISSRRNKTDCRSLNVTELKTVNVTSVVESIHRITNALQKRRSAVNCRKPNHFARVCRSSKKIMNIMSSECEQTDELFIHQLMMDKADD